MKQSVYLLTILLLISCQTITQNKNMIDKKSPEYKVFIGQEHRFELNGIESKYNGKPFKLGMTLKDFYDVFGKESKVYRTEYYDEGSKRCFWKDQGIEVSVKKSLVVDIRIYLEETYREYPDINISGNKSVIFNNSILNQSDRMQDFIEKSDLTFDEIGITSNGYRLTFPYEGKEFVYFLDSPVSYHRVGGGHLSTSGDWKLDETNEIKSIHLYLRNNN